MFGSRNTYNNIYNIQLGGVGVVPVGTGFNEP